ncbi:MAG: ATP-dependent DNA ligase [Chloroflexota bacterium]|nr:MAG: ATP-dependent DNA ligase [Chloroflexota bacterium]
MTDKKVEINSHTIELSHLDKVLFPDDGITKGDLIDYYQRIAAIMLPHLADHPLSLQRFPNGIQAEGFYQKEMPDYFPDWIRRVSVEVKEDQVRQDQVVCDNVETLVYLANQACITLHPWLSRADKLNHPDKLIFDLDPPGNDFETVRFAAGRLREMLQEVGLVPFVMTTGSKGLHVVAPLDQSADFDEVRAFVRELADELARREPKRLTTETRKNQRQGRVFLDYLRNAYGQTGVATYTLRAKPGAPVATPLDWAELADPQLHSQSYTMRNIFHRLGQKADPWQDIRNHARALKG